MFQLPSLQQIIDFIKQNWWLILVVVVLLLLR